MGTLTVKELISLPEKMPQDLPVISGEYMSIAEPEVVTDISMKQLCNTVTMVAITTERTQKFVVVLTKQRRE